MSDANLADKWAKVVKKIPDWCSGADSKNEEELKQEIIKQQAILAELDHTMANDAKLIAVTQELKDLKKDYREEMVEAQAKSAYCLYVLRSRGKDVGGGK